MSHKKFIKKLVIALLILSSFLSARIKAAEEVYYETGDSINDNVAFVINGYTFGFSRNQFTVSQAEYSEEKLKVTTANHFLASDVDDGFVLAYEEAFGTVSYLYLDQDGVKKSETQTGHWQIEEGKLKYTADETECYLSITEGNVIITSDPAEAGAVSIYSGEEKPSHRIPDPQPTPDDANDVSLTFTKQPSVIPYVIEGSGYEAPAYDVEVSIDEKADIEELTFTWYLNDEPYRQNTVEVSDHHAADSLIVDELCDLPYGVYPIRCEVSYNVEGTIRSTSSYTVNFIVARGVRDNSILTFSDVHETWDHVGTSISDIMNSNGGYLPSLIIATGDFNTRYLAGQNDEFIERCLKTLINRISLQTADIDTVWVSGNHDNGYAAAFTNANAEADLGVNLNDYQDLENDISGTGIIFDTRSDSFRNNAYSSRNNDQGLIVIGINYEDIGADGAYENVSNGRPDAEKLSYGDPNSHDTVYEHLKTALTRVSENYNDELVVISAHAGLHAVGIDPDSAVERGGVWPGHQDYSIADSNGIVRLINSYADEYGIDALFLFGHDHSRGEKEFYKLPGDIIYATDESYRDSGTYEELTLKFAYAQAGYLTDRIGGSKLFSYITWDEEVINRQMRQVGADEKSDLSFNISRIKKDEAEEKETVIPETVIPEKEDIITRYVIPLTGVDRVYMTSQR